MKEDQADCTGSKEYQDKQNNNDGHDLESAGAPLGSGKPIKEWLSSFFHNRAGQARK